MSINTEFQIPKKTILICGGAGFIGSNFIRHLYRARPEYRIVNFDLLTYSGNLKNLDDVVAEDAMLPESHRRYLFVQGDICDTTILDRLFEEYHFDLVVNFAAESHVDRSLCSSYDFMRTNVLGTHTLIEACRKHVNPRFVQISTDEVYGDVLSGYSSEDAPLNASSPYSASKAGADVLIKSYMRSHRLRAVIIRGSNNFGPYQYPEKLIPLAISNFIEEKRIPVHGAGTHVRHWLHVLDFCRAIDLVAHLSADNQIYNVCGTPKTNIDVLEAIRRALKLPHHLDMYKVHTNDRPGADMRYAPNDAKIRRDFAFAPEHPFDETIEDVVSWYLENASWWREIKTRPTFIEHYKKQERADYY